MISGGKINNKFIKMNKTEITEIVEKELLKFFDAKTLLRHNKEIMEFSIEATLKAINYTPCCKT